ncbi:hypothetical protein [Moraxella lincolnii]|uniref:hypothetical protein n=1 Tax=Lwoffella lincolnii TaxID=90241 RepID=UPI000991B3E8|nr:hypothetical protein [Moraxella lincolnii]
MRLIYSHHIKSPHIKLALLLTVGMMAGCQTTPTTPVMQRANQVYETTGFGSSKVKAQRMALANAKSTCGIKSPIILTDKITYNGVLDERTDRVIQKAGQIATSVLGLGKASLASDEDYEFAITFRCE